MQAMCVDMNDMKEKILQMMTLLQNQIGQGTPSNAKNNHWRDGKEHVNATALRSGKKPDNPSAPIHEEEKLLEAIDKLLKEIENEKPIKEIVEMVAEPVISKSSMKNVPFLFRLDDKKEEGMKLILEVFLICLNPSTLVCHSWNS
ncbi:hypothetical protein V6Z11_A06G168500 [Gossypium hirsutum]